MPSSGRRLREQPVSPGKKGGPGPKNVEKNIPDDRVPRFLHTFQNMFQPRHTIWVNTNSQQSCPTTKEGASPEQTPTRIEMEDQEPGKTVNMIPRYVAVRRDETQQLGEALLLATSKLQAKPGERAASAAMEAARLAHEDFSQARQALASAVQILYEMDSLIESQVTSSLKREEHRAFLETLQRIKQRAKTGSLPCHGKPQEQPRPVLIAAKAVAQDARRRLRGIAATALKEAKGRYQNGPYRTASSALAAAKETCLIAQARLETAPKDATALSLLATAHQLAKAAMQLKLAEDRDREVRTAATKNCDIS